MMSKIWNQIKDINIVLSSNLKNEFTCKFDSKVPEEMKAKLLQFVGWVEKTYGLKTPVYVQFEQKNYVLTEDRERVGYLFYWADFDNYPNFDDEEDIPVIVLPVKDEQWTYDEIIGSFVEALTDYYAWCLNIIEDYELDEEEVEEIAESYLKTLK